MKEQLDSFDFIITQIQYRELKDLTQQYKKSQKQMQLREKLLQGKLYSLNGKIETLQCQQNEAIQQKNKHIRFLSQNVLELSKRMIDFDEIHEDIQRQVQMKQQRQSFLLQKIDSEKRLFKQIQSQRNQINHLLLMQKDFLNIQQEIVQMKQLIKQKDIIMLNQRAIIEQQKSVIAQRQGEISVRQAEIQSRYENTIKSLKDYTYYMEIEDENSLLKSKNTILLKDIKQLENRLEWMKSIKIPQRYSLQQVNTDHNHQILEKFRCLLEQFYEKLKSSNPLNIKQLLQQRKQQFSLAFEDTFNEFIAKI